MPRITLTGKERLVYIARTLNQTKTKAQLCEELGLNKSQIDAMTGLLRKKGVDIPYATKQYGTSMYKEAVADITRLYPELIKQ